MDVAVLDGCANSAAPVLQRPPLRAAVDARDRRGVGLVCDEREGQLWLVRTEEEECAS